MAKNRAVFVGDAADGNEAQPTVTEVMQAIGMRTGDGRRSGLYTWMYQHHDELAAQFGEAPPDWPSLTEALFRLNIRDRTCRKLSVANARRTWWVVRQDVTKARRAWSAGGKVGSPTVARPVVPTDQAHGAGSVEEDPADGIAQPTQTLKGSGQ